MNQQSHGQHKAVHQHPGQATGPANSGKPASADGAKPAGSRLTGKKNETVLGAFTVRDLTVFASTLLLFVASLIPMFASRYNLWNLGNLFFLGLGIILPLIVTALFVARRLSPESRVRIGSLSIDQFASVVASFSLGFFFLSAAQEFVPVLLVGLIGSVGLFAATVLARFIPFLAGDFLDRAEVPAHVVARESAAPFRKPSAPKEPKPAKEPGSGTLAGWSKRLTAGAAGGGGAADAPAASKGAPASAVQNGDRPYAGASAGDTPLAATQHGATQYGTPQHVPAQHEPAQRGAARQGDAVPAAAAGVAASSGHAAGNNAAAAAGAAAVGAAAASRGADASPATQAADVVPSASERTQAAAAVSAASERTQAAAAVPSVSERTQAAGPAAGPERTQAAAAVPAASERTQAAGGPEAHSSQATGAVPSASVPAETMLNPQVRSQEPIGATVDPYSRPEEHEEQPVHEAFWFAVAQPRTAIDERTGMPAFVIDPGGWVLALEDRGHEFLVQHTDGRVGVLRDLSNIERG
ncbi:hypothetical protein JOE31_001118 [Arthrobacter sp. PvP023]|uniref:hypothetical protein n=1 Tax=Micrococcaceae TaxID=1268 RepID=UPI001AEA740B|nr:hypothetical protein [Arthrobacter sp. PvP023]MBP1134886.1 hypothetical protein [Arthrobacter sp. PvP023]